MNLPIPPARKHVILRALPALVLLLFAASPASAQLFGKNKVHYKTFDWSVISTEHFEVYFYGEERETAIDAARMAERAYKRLSRVLDHEISHPVPLILYASHADFQQTNITPGLINEGTGGITEFYKQRVFLPFTGSYGELVHVLTHELVHAFQVDILFGDGVGVVANPFAFQPPLWLMEGSAEYLSLGGVDPHTRMWLRDAALEGYLVPLSVLAQVRDIRVYRFGQSICEYIGRHYGDEKLGEIFRRAPEMRSVEEAIQQTIGVSAERLSELWMEEVRRTYLPEIASHQTADEVATQLTHHDRDLSSLNLAPEVSPRGDRMVFISDRSLYQDIYLASTIDGKILDRLVKGERSGDLESLRFLNASLTWSPDEKQIAFVSKAGADDIINILDVDKKEIKGRVDFDGMDGIISPDWSPDGERFVFVGLEAGQSDLYLCNVDGSGVQRLTEDRYMDLQPRWSPDGKRIAFMTDRGPDTDFSQLVFGDSRVAIYDLEKETIELLPGQDGKNVSPVWSPDGNYLAYVSDRTGISNIFATQLETGETFLLTDILTGVTGITAGSPAMSWSRGGDRLVFCGYSQGGYDIFTIKSPLDQRKPYREVHDEVIAAREPNVPDPAEARRTADTLLAKLEERELPLVADATDAAGETGAAGATDAAGETVAPDGKDTANETVAPEEKGGADEKGTPAEEGAPDETDVPGDTELAKERDAVSDSVATTTAPMLKDLAFVDFARVSPSDESEKNAEKEGGDEMSDAERLTAAEDEEELPDPDSFEVKPYQTRFTRDFSVGGAAFASNVGFAGQTAIGFSDILGNHNIYIGASVFGSISDSDLIVSYTNLSRRTNYGIALFQYRDDYYINTPNEQDTIESRIYRGVQLAWARPFNKFARLEWSLKGVALSESVLREWYYGGPSIEDHRGTVFYVNPSVALVTDNVLWGLTGPISGGRSRWEIGQSIGEVNNTTIIADMRRYHNIRQRYVFANRLIGAFSGGAEEEYFRVGGPFTFRGADWGDMIGTQLAIANVEFRYPLIDRLKLVWPLSLDFRGIQGVLFTDGAAVWNHGFRFWRDGHLDTPRMAYGFGARMNLGYFILRYDWAQATDLEHRLGGTRHFFTLGGDF